jgi:hypothetical protein
MARCNLLIQWSSRKLTMVRGTTCDKRRNAPTERGLGDGGAT